jgi:hypothetical protein
MGALRHAPQTATAPGPPFIRGAARACVRRTSASATPIARPGRPACARTRKLETESTRTRASPCNAGSTPTAKATPALPRPRTFAAAARPTSRATPPPIRAALMRTAARVHQSVATRRRWDTGRASRLAPSLASAGRRRAKAIACLIVLRVPCRAKSALREGLLSISWGGCSARLRSCGTAASRCGACE